MALPPISSNGFTTPQPVQPGADAARQAAQRAFFDAALGRAGAPAAARPAAAPMPAAPAAAAYRRPEIRPDPAAEAPAKPLRPGSLLDIRV